MLIYSWNHSQITCYALLKLLLKEVIKKNENVDKLFCSYFLKTVIFWLSEELSIQKGCPCVNQIYYRSVPIKPLSEQCYLLMILVASHRNAVYQPTALL
jgi:hypothetical protein